jgi:hypothetical protein
MMTGIVAVVGMGDVWPLYDASCFWCHNAALLSVEKLRLRKRAS